jgi:Tfp pilus assembly protein PilO
MNKIILLPLMIIVIIYFVIFHLVPSFKETLALRDTRDAKIVELEKVKKQKNDLIKFMNEVDNHQSEMNFVSNYIPKDPKENDILNIINQKAKEDNVALLIIGFQDRLSQEKSEDVDSVVMSSTEVNMNFVGSYDDVKNFLKKVFYINRSYTLESLKIEKLVSNKSEDKPTGSLNIKAVFNFKYIPNDLSISTNDISNGLKDNYKFVNEIIEKSIQSTELEKTVPGRVNPFMPS